MSDTDRGEVLHMKGLIDCTKVYVAASPHGGVGAFALVPIARGEVVETGIVRRLPTSFNGNSSPHVFTWSEDRTVWAIGSGCSTFYNTSTSPNTKMTRHFAEDSFVIHALRDIEPDEELTHVYMSLGWRDCFADLRDGSAGT
jgi:SET domain-containing protein